MFDALKKLFRPKKKIEDTGVRRRAVESRFDETLSRLRSRLDRFLVTRSVPAGEIKKTASWTLTKTNAGLFRFESPGASILISTEPFLAKKDGKLSGLLRMSEASLCRVLNEGGEFRDFLRLAEPLKQRYRELVEPEERFEPSEFPGIDDLMDWESFDIYQMIARSTPNMLVHVLVHASPEASMRLREQLSIRKKEMLIEEMEALLSPGSQPLMNPHTHNLSLLEYEESLAGFRLIMKEYLIEKRGRQQRKMLQPDR
jgi:hypothetical protein